jgi:protocatechuate 3,4-dioxygenase beta subunit
MERKKFIRSMTILAGTFPTLLYACSKSIGDAASSAGSVTEADSGSGNSACVEAPEETAGPFPSKTPASLVRSDITDGKTGYPLAIHITVSNSNNNCAALAGVIVDIWHCDSEGNYSEYGGTTMQQTDYESVHFLRGRQTTDDNGLVSFTSIFPGWYEGRATHIHVHVYNAAGLSGRKRYCACAGERI